MLFWDEISTYKTCKICTIHFLELFTYQDTILIAYNNHKVGNFATTINFTTFVYTFWL